MRQILPSFGIAAALMFAGCPTPPNNNEQDTCADDASICGAGTVCDLASETCVAEDCNNTENPNFCDANEVCNAGTGQCEEEILIQNCTSLDGSTTIQPNSIDVTIPGEVPATAVLTDVQFGAEGDSADTVFQINLPENSDLIVQTEVANGQPAQDTVLTLRSATCDGNIIATADNVNAVNGEAAILNARSLPAGEYFLFVDSKSTAPITEAVQLRVSRVEIVSEGLGCVAGASTERCADGLTCLSPIASGNVESFNSCEPFAIDGTRLFITDATGLLYELDPANGDILNQAPLPIPTTGTEHQALGYDSVGNRLFFHSSDNIGIDDLADGIPGNGTGTIANTEVIVLNSEDFSRITQWGIPANFQIEGLGFSNRNNLITAFDVLSNEVQVLDPADGSPELTYTANDNDSQEFGGLGVDSFSTKAAPSDTNPNNDRGFSTRSIQNQVFEFELGVGTPLRTVGAPPVAGFQCGLGAKGDFGFVAYTEGIIRVVALENEALPGLSEGDFVTEYRTPGINPCGIDAGGL